MTASERCRHLDKFVCYCLQLTTMRLIRNLGLLKLSHMQRVILFQLSDGSEEAFKVRSKVWEFGRLLGVA